jgi:hypothetical protein
MSDEKKCEQRIDDELEGRMEQFRQAMNDAGILYKHTCPGCGHEWTSSDEWDMCPTMAEECDYTNDVEGEETDDEVETMDSLSESVLAISKEIVYKIEFSYGGPQDYFMVFVDPDDNQINKIEYHFLDWFDGATRILRGEDFDTAEQVFLNWIVLE